MSYYCKINIDEIYNVQDECNEFKWKSTSMIDVANNHDNDNMIINNDNSDNT